MRITPLLTTIILIAISLDRTELCGQMLGPNFNSAVQLVVLKNGELFRGRVSRKSEQVIIETVQGSRIVLSADETDFVCNTMEEAYWGKSARTRASDTHGQVDLFNWCLKNKLLEQAQNQIDILCESDIKAADLEFIDRQLNVAIQQQKHQQQRLAKQTISEQPVDHPGPPPIHSPDAGSGQSTMPSRFALTPIQLDNSIGVANLQITDIDTTVFRPLPAFPSDAHLQSTTLATVSETNNVPDRLDNPPTIQQVGFNQPIEFGGVSTVDASSQNAQPMQPLDAALVRDDRIMTSVAELEREMRELPRGSVGNYRQKVERMFTVGCSAANCHDSNSQIMPLLHRGLSQTIPLRQSQRNLHNILTYIDRENPFESRLLIAASTVHAGNVEPIIERGTPNYEHLTQWLVSISDDPSQVFSPKLQLEQTETNDQRSNSMKQVRPVKPAPDSFPPPGESAMKLPSTIGEIPELDTQPIGFIPIDPFDPEIFNRQFGGK